MKRIVKKPAVRRQEIMNAAKSLFEKEGYAKTSVESIIKKLGLAKGTFYYYFKTKKDILEALVEQTCIELEKYFSDVIQKTNLTALQKLKLTLRGPEKQKLASSAVMKIIHHPENRELQEKLNIQTIIRISPLLHQIFIEGKKQGIFTKTPSLESVQLMLASSLFILDSGLFSWSNKKKSEFISSLQDMMAWMLGVKSIDLQFIFNKKAK